MKNYSLLLIQIIFMILISIPEVECQELEVLGNVKVQNGNEGEGKILVSDEFGNLDYINPNYMVINYLASLPNGIDNLLGMGETPYNIWESGIPYDTIIGKNYEGGILFYIDTLNIHPFEGLICAEYDIDSASPWGCENIFIGGTSESLGSGKANTSIIVNSNCPDSYINPAVQCDNVVINGYDDWFLPSIDELREIDVSIGFAGNGSNYNKANLGLYTWSSSERSALSSWAAYWELIGPGQSLFTFNAKGWAAPSIRPIRSY